MRIGERTYNVKLGFSIFLAISIISIALMLYLDVDKRTWEGLREIKPKYGLIAGALMLIQWLFNALRFQILINSFEQKVKLRTSFNAFMSNLFMSAMTPSQSGGGALQIFVLNKAGVPIAKAFAGCLMGAVLTVVCLVFTNICIFLFEPSLRLSSSHHMRAVLSTVIMIFLLLALLFVLSLFKMSFIKRIFGKIILLILHLIKAKRRFMIVRKFLHGLDQYSECMKSFAGAKKHRVLIAGIITFLGLGASNLIGPVLLMGLNVQVKFPQIFLIQFVINFILYFSPTPGASGVAEFSNYWILSAVNIEQSLLGIYTVIWRFFTSFIGVGVGAIIVLNMVKNEGRKYMVEKVVGKIKN